MATVTQKISMTWSHGRSLMSSKEIQTNYSQKKQQFFIINELVQQYYV